MTVFFCTLCFFVNALVLLVLNIAYVILVAIRSQMNLWTYLIGNPLSEPPGTLPQFIAMYWNICVKRHYKVTAYWREQAWKGQDVVVADLADEDPLTPSPVPLVTRVS